MNLSPSRTRSSASYETTNMWRRRTNCGSSMPQWPRSTQARSRPIRRLPRPLRDSANNETHLFAASAGGYRIDRNLSFRECQPDSRRIHRTTFLGCHRAYSRQSGFAPRVTQRPGCVTVYPFRIFYRARSDTIEILHIRHAARRPMEGIDPELK